MRNSVVEFRADLQAFADQTKLNIKAVVRAVVFELFRRIVMRTPVDTGRAAASWNVSKDQPGIEMADERSFHGLNKGAAAAVLQGALNKLDRVTFDPPEGVWWIYNNLPYIQVLEYGLYPNPPKKGTGKSVGGFSVQAPQGMVRVSVAEVESLTDSELELIVK